MRNGGHFVAGGRNLLCVSCRIPDKPPLFVLRFNSCLRNNRSRSIHQAVFGICARDSVKIRFQALEIRRRPTGSDAVIRPPIRRRRLPRLRRDKCPLDLSRQPLLFLHLFQQLGLVITGTLPVFNKTNTGTKVSNPPPPALSLRILYMYFPRFFPDSLIVFPPLLCPSPRRLNLLSA